MYLSLEWLVSDVFPPYVLWKKDEIAESVASFNHLMDSRFGPSTWPLRSTGYGSTSEETQWTITQRWALLGMEELRKTRLDWRQFLITVIKGDYWHCRSRFLPLFCLVQLSTWEMLPNWISKQKHSTDFALRPFELKAGWRSLGSGRLCQERQWLTGWTTPLDRPATLPSLA